MSETRPFAPAWGSTSVVANAVAATAAVNIPSSCEQVCLTNTSATATTFVVVTPYFGATPPTGTAPTLTQGFPIPPGRQVIITVGPGPAVIRTIASAADGNIIITPGNGI